jgi:Holliday junction resolvase
MSGTKHKRKGSRVERELVRAHLTIGVQARRMPLSGAAGGDFSGDFLLDLVTDGLGKWTLRGECKARANGQGFKTLEGWLGTNDLLILRRDRAQPMVLLPWDTWARLLVRAQTSAESQRVIEEYRKQQEEREAANG